jgi:hypothetical protein
MAAARLHSAFPIPLLDVSSVGTAVGPATVPLVEREAAVPLATAAPVLVAGIAALNPLWETRLELFTVEK